MVSSPFSWLGRKTKKGAAADKRGGAPPPPPAASPPHSMSPPQRSVAAASSPTGQPIAPGLLSTPGLPGLRPNPTQPPPSGGTWIPPLPTSPQQPAHISQQGSATPPPVQLPPRPPSPGRPPSPYQIPAVRAQPASYVPPPYVPPPWKARAGQGYRPRNVDISRRATFLELGVPRPGPGKNTPFFGGRTPDQFFVPPSNPFKALEIGPGFKRASDPDRSMPPNVFQHPKNRNPPPHVRAALDHPLSLADAADPPNIYGHDALCNVPEFPARWLDPQPIVDFFVGTYQAPALKELRPASGRVANLGTELGLLLAPHGTEWRVSEVLPRGPAAQSNSVHVGDIIKAVNGTTLRGVSEHSVAAAVGGPAGTQAVLQVQKQSQNSAEVYTVFLQRQDAAGVQAPARYEYNPEAMQRDNEALKETLLQYPQGLQTQGVLECEIVEAQNLPSVDMLGLAPDTYVEVTSQDQKKQSSTKYKTKDPKWGEILAVSIFDPEEARAKYNKSLSSEMLIQIYSPSLVGNPQLVGTITFPLLELVKGLQDRGAGEGWYELQRYDSNDDIEVVKGQGGQASQLYIRLRYMR